MLKNKKVLKYKKIKCYKNKEVSTPLWTPLPCHTFKVNTNAAMGTRGDTTTLGMIIRDVQG